MNASNIAAHAIEMAYGDWLEDHKRNSTPSTQYDEEESKLYRIEYNREWRRLEKENKA